MKQLRGYLIYGTIVFAAITVAVGLAAQHHGSTSSAGGSFLLSLSASFLEDLVFFAVVGAIALLVSIRDPSAEPLESRLGYLFNGSRISVEARRHVEENIKREGTYCPKYVYVIEYGAADTTIDAIKATVDASREIFNMIRDHAIVYDDKYEIFTDNIANAPGGVQGELLTVTLTGCSGDNQNNVVSAIPITQASLVKQLQFELPADGAAQFNYKYWVWHKRGENFVFSCKRYTENVQIRVVNRTSQDLKLDCLIHKKQVVLTPNSQHLYTFTHAMAVKKPLFKLL